MWGAFRLEDPLPWGEAGKGGFLWGRRLCGRPLTPSLSRGERGKRVVPLKRLTPQPGPLVSAGRDRKTPHPNPLPQERDKSGASLRALTPHTVALPRTEGEELRGGAGLVWPGAGDRGRATRTPTLSLKRPLRNPRDCCPEDPHPNPLPQGEGARAARTFEDEGRCAKVSLEGDLCVTPGVGCPEDPHPNPLPQGEGARAARTFEDEGRSAKVSQGRGRKRRFMGPGWSCGRGGDWM